MQQQQNILSSQAHMQHSPKYITFGAINHNLTSLKEITQCLISDYSRIKLVINGIKILGKSPNTWTLNNTHLNDTWDKQEMSRESKIHSELDKSGNKLITICGMQ